MSLKEWSNEDLESAKQTLETTYPFLNDILQLSNNAMTNGGLPSKGGPDEINKPLKGDRKLTTIDELRKKVASLRADAGVVAVGKEAETPEQSKDVDYSDFITQIVDAISDLKKETGSGYEVFAAKLAAIEANQKLLAVQFEQLKAQASPKKLGEQFDTEVQEGGVSDEKRSKMQEKRASKKGGTSKKAAEEEPVEEEDKTSETASEEADANIEAESEEEDTSVEAAEEESKAEAPKVAAKKAIEQDRTARASAKSTSGKGVTSSEGNEPSIPKEYAWLGDILKAHKKAFGQK